MTYSQGMGRHCPCELVSLYTPLDFESSQTSGHNWSNALGTMRGLVCQCTGLSILVLVNGSCCMLLGTERTLAWLIWTSTNHCLIGLNIYKHLLDWFEHLQTLPWSIWTSTNICLIGLNIYKPLLDWFEHQQIFTYVETDLILSREGAVHTLGTFPYNDVYFQFPANWWRYSPVNYSIRLQYTNSKQDGSDRLIIIKCGPTTFF